MSSIKQSTPVPEQGAGIVASAGSESRAQSRAQFPATARIHAKADFSRVFETGQRAASPRLAVHWLPDSGAPRLGLAVSRKVDRRAVGRNRIKRALRELFRHERAQLRNGLYVIVARSDAARSENSALQTTFRTLLQRLHALPPLPAPGTMPTARSPSSNDSVR